MATSPNNPDSGSERRVAKPVPFSCGECGSTILERMPRVGFMQKFIMPFFHRYPWRCGSCGKTVYRQVRSVRPRRNTK